MQKVKHVIESKTVWGVVLMLAAFALRSLWPEEFNELIELSGTFCGAALAVYGRFQAKEGLRL